MDNWCILVKYSVQIQQFKAIDGLNSYFPNFAMFRLLTRILALQVPNTFDCNVCKNSCSTRSAIRAKIKTVHCPTLLFWLRKCSVRKWYCSQPTSISLMYLSTGQYAMHSLQLYFLESSCTSLFSHFALNERELKLQLQGNDVFRTCYKCIVCCPPTVYSCTSLMIALGGAYI